MKVYHTTATFQVASIAATGLRVEYAQGKEQAVWLTTASKVHWAIAHIQRRHGVALEDVVTIESTVPRPWLRRAWAGIWKCYHDIPPERLGALRSGLSWAQSPADEGMERG